jgi:hypothetical protein
MRNFENSKPSAVKCRLAEKNFTDPIFVNVDAAQESIPPGRKSIPGLL